MERRHVFIGDIHGCRDEVMDLLRRIRLRSGDVVVAVGDLVRKGPLAREVIETWMTSGYLSVLGNNDAKLIARARAPLRRIVAPAGDRRVMRDPYAMKWLGPRARLPDLCR